ncbi:MAG: hypothetical protein M3395_09010 [Chloroflexota bacterium]|nr:hypothetical protein [Chloroflexota bacterium]
MPTYEYVCLSCARRADVLHGIHVQGPTTCQVCGGTLRKAISAAAVVFKGSGWAKKDAARAAARPASGEAKTDGPSGDAEGKKEAESGAAKDRPIGGDGPGGQGEDRSTADGKVPSQKAAKPDSGASSGRAPAKGSTRKGSPSAGSED